MLGLYGWALEPDLGGDAPALLLERLVARGLPFALVDGRRRFDPAEAINAVIAAGLTGAESAWRDRFVGTGQALACSLDPAPCRYAVTFERTFDLRALAGRERLRLRLPRPIEDHALMGLSLDIEAPGCAVDEAFGRIELRLAGPPPAALTAGFTARFASRPDICDPAQPGDGDRWLNPAEGFVQVTPLVRALADELAAGRHDEHAVVAALRDHLIDRYACGIVAYESIAGPATDHVIRHGWYDCQLGSALLVALCRARGIPARLVGGYLLWPAAPSRHMWCEIWLGGWRPFDLLAWDLSAGGRDPAWRGSFAGRIEHRMKTEIWPDIFTGPMSLALPAAHHRIATRTATGIAIDHRTIADEPIYRDRISVVPDPA